MQHPARADDDDGHFEDRQAVLHRLPAGDRASRAPARRLHRLNDAGTNDGRRHPAVASILAALHSAHPAMPDDALAAPTSPALEAYLAPLTSAAQRERGTEVRLRLTSYVTDVPPPVEHVRSVRCVAFRGGRVLALRDRVGAHVLPGGRREPGETLRQTLERELLEETGWTIGVARLIGVVRLHWLQERPAHLPEDSPYYPDFLWLIHTAEAAAHRPEALQPQEGDGVPVWLPLADPATAAELACNEWAPENGVYLPAALRVRGPARR